MPNCEHCKEKPSALHFCDSILCSNCLEKHYLYESCPHRPTPLTMDSRKDELKAICEKHSSYYTTVCADCSIADLDTLLCRYCEHRVLAHKGHNKISICESASSIKEVMRVELNTQKRWT